MKHVETSLFAAKSTLLYADMGHWHKEIRAELQS